MATIVVAITGENHLRVAWRVCLGIGIIPPLSLLYLRLKLQEPEAFKRESLANAKTPWLLICKFYWFRLSIVSIIWFIYDFSAYSFGIYGSSILANLLGEDYPLWKSLAWNILLNFFYTPGALAGAFDYVDIDDDGIAWCEVRNSLAQTGNFFLLKSLNQVHFYDSIDHRAGAAFAQ